MTESRRRHSQPLRWLALVSSAGTAFACASYSPHQGARLTPMGKNEAAFAADALVLDRGLGPELFALPEFALSRGLSRDWDLGGRVYPFGLEVNARHRILERGGYLASVMPLFAVSQVSATNPDTNFVELTSGGVLLNGITLGPRLHLSLGLRSQLRLGLNAVSVREDFDAANWALLSGTSAALHWRVSEQSTLIPGVVVLFPYDFERDDWDFPLFQGGAAITW